MRRPSREQEVLHYQWFADLGSVEAQRAVGQIFSHGALRNPEQALRYFRYGKSATVLPKQHNVWFLSSAMVRLHLELAWTMTCLKSMAHFLPSPLVFSLPCTVPSAGQDAVHVSSVWHDQLRLLLSSNLSVQLQVAS